MRLGDFLTNGQTEACAVIAPVGAAPESVEYQRELFFRDARPLIPYFHGCCIKGNSDFGSLRRMLNSIFNEIFQQGKQRTFIRFPHCSARIVEYDQSHACRVRHAL